MTKHEQPTEQIVLRVTPSTRNAIERAASDEGRSLANMVRRLLDRSLAEREHRPEVAA